MEKNNLYKVDLEILNPLDNTYKKYYATKLHDEGNLESIIATFLWFLKPGDKVLIEVFEKPVKDENK